VIIIIFCITQVLVRIRPLNSAEVASQGYNRCLKQESANTVTWLGPPETRFTFDHVACETITQVHILTLWIIECR